ncbi:hypothetical protein O3P69_018648 [Scylla paramamosain]|uniref:Uncharacterized protein n=1 Tax=Scylla paramamosain TaxID=85552 RepID=A0AAW0T2S1_SCYPA
MAPHPLHGDPPSRPHGGGGGEGGTAGGGEEGPPQPHSAVAQHRHLLLFYMCHPCCVGTVSTRCLSGSRLQKTGVCEGRMVNQSTLHQLSTPSRTSRCLVM